MHIYEGNCSKKGSKLSCNTLVIKLGGSLITDKSQPLTIRWDSLIDVASQLSKFYKEFKPKMIIVHGGGSFGHYEVERIKKLNRVIDLTSTSIIQKSMLTLALAVINVLIESGIPVTLHPAHTICKNNKSDDCNFEPLINDLSKGLVPVTFGDAIYDNEGKIISGDDLSVSLSNITNSDCLFFATDVEGVLDENGNVIKEIKKDFNISILRKQGFDVTGGIASKINKAFNSKSGNVRILSGKKIYQGLIGKEVGTKIINS